MAYLTHVGCCGMAELTSVHNEFYTKNFKAIVKAVKDAGAHRKAFLFFSLADYQWENGGLQGAEAFAKFVETNELGTVKEVAENKNNNSGHKLKAWIWALNTNGIQKFGGPAKYEYTGTAATPPTPRSQGVVASFAERQAARRSRAAQRGWETRRRRASLGRSRNS